MKKLSISWLEVILLLFIVLIGMGIWEVAEKRARAALGGQEPREQDYGQNSAISQAALTAALNNLTQAETQIGKLQEEIKQGEKVKAMMEAAEPWLLSVPSVPTQTLTLLQGDGEAYLKVMAELQVEQENLINLNKQMQELWGDVETIRPATNTDVSPLEDPRLALMIAEVEALQTELVKVRLSIYMKQASLKSLRSANPALNQLPLTIDDESQASQAIKIHYLNNILELHQARESFHLLNEEKQDYTQEVNKAYANLVADRQSELTRFSTARKNFEISIRTKSLKTAGLGCLLLFAASFILLKLLNRFILPLVNEIDIVMVLGGAGLTLAILYGFQYFQLLGAGLAVIAAILLSLVFLFIRQESPSAGRQEGTR